MELVNYIVAWLELNGVYYSNCCLIIYPKHHSDFFF